MRPSFWKMNEIIDIVRDGEKKTAICIGRDDFGLPKHLSEKRAPRAINRSQE